MYSAPRLRQAKSLCFVGNTSIVVIGSKVGILGFQVYKILKLLPPPEREGNQNPGGGENLSIGRSL